MQRPVSRTGRWKTKPAARVQTPEAARLAMVILVRPSRSASLPASRLPSAPAEMAAGSGQPGGAHAPTGLLVAGEQAERHPGPHRVELPHVAEIAEVGEPRRPVRQHPRRRPPVERRRLAEIRAGFDEKSADHRRDDRETGGQQEHRPPGRHAAGRGVEEVRQRRAQGDGAHQQADAEAAVLPAPGGHQLHPRRIDPGEGEAGEEPAGERRARRQIQQRDGGVERRGGERAHRQQALRRQAVGEGEKRAQQRPGHEAELHAGGQPGLQGAREPPRRRELRHHRRRREPDRHGEQRGESQQRDVPPLGAEHAGEGITGPPPRPYPGLSVGLLAPSPGSGGESPPRASASSRRSRSG